MHSQSVHPYIRYQPPAGACQQLQDDFPSAGQRVCLHSVCHSGIKFLRAMRRAQTEEDGRDSVWKGAKAEEKGVVPGLPADSLCPELAQHVDSKPLPDLKLPFQPERKEVKGFKDKSNQCKTRTWFIFSFFSDHSDWLQPSLYKRLWLCDIWSSFNVGRLSLNRSFSKERSDTGPVTEYCSWMFQECNVLLRVSSTGWTLCCQPDLNWGLSPHCPTLLSVFTK